MIPLRHKIACGLEPEALAAAFKFEETKGWVAIVDRGDWYDVLADGAVVAAVSPWAAPPACATSGVGTRCATVGARAVTSTSARDRNSPVGGWRQC